MDKEKTRKVWRPEGKPMGRPFGTFGSYKPDHLKRLQMSINFEAWLIQKLKAKKYPPGSNQHDYFRDLILKDTGWKCPKM